MYRRAMSPDSILRVRDDTVKYARLRYDPALVPLESA